MVLRGESFFVVICFNSNIFYITYIFRHFLVPLAIAQRPRWRRKGTKLHIYNDHTFIAKHLSGGLMCDICNRSIPRRPGKQGYECRDCMTKCHKQCHVRAPQACPNATVLSIEL